MLRSSKEQDTIVLTNKLEQMIENRIQLLVDFDSQIKFTDTRKRSQSKLPSKKLRSFYDNVFNWKKHCFLCENAVDLKYSKNSNVINVRAIPILENMKAIANERQDKWGDSLLGRLESCNYLVAKETMHHINLYDKV